MCPGVFLRVGAVCSISQSLKPKQNPTTKMPNAESRIRMLKRPHAFVKKTNSKTKGSQYVASEGQANVQTRTSLKFQPRAMDSVNLHRTNVEQAKCTGNQW